MKLVALAGASLLVACAAPKEMGASELPALPDFHDRDLRDEVIYQVMVDRFDDAGPEPQDAAAQTVPDDLARIQGGDWRGLRRRLPYIRDLGMTAIWISPIFENVARYVDEDGYHGYWASDLTRLNPYFGDLADLQALVTDAHALQLKVFVDVAPNHLGQVFAYDLDGDGSPSQAELLPIFRQGGPYSAPLIWSHLPAFFRGRAAASDARDTPSPRLERVLFDTGHFHRRGALRNFSDPQEVELGDFPKGLRDLSTEQPDVLTALLDTYAEWVRLIDIDGFRLDAVPHASREFWTALCSGLRARLLEQGKPNFFIFGEVFRSEPQTLASYTSRGSMDSVFDFTFWSTVVGEYVLAGAPASTAVTALREARSFYGTQPQPDGVGLDAWQARLAFADNHDTGRILGKLPDPYAVELAMTLVYTVDAIPVVYYGTEQGFDGKTQHAAREPMWWAGYSDRYPLVAHLRKLALARRAHPALTRGSLTIRYASPESGTSTSPDAGLLAFERSFAADRVLVVSNAHARHTAVAVLETGFRPGTRLEDALGEEQDWLVGDDGSLAVRVPPRTAIILSAR